MEERKNGKKARLGLVGGLTILFILLKLTGRIVWPWLWVLSPVWITALLLALTFGAILVGGRIQKGKW